MTRLSGVLATLAELHTNTYILVVDPRRNEGAYAKGEVYPLTHLVSLDPRQYCSSNS